MGRSIKANIGDTIYFKYSDGTIGEGTVIRIESDEYEYNGKIYKYNNYYIDSNACIEDYNCLSTKHPKVIKYLLEQAKVKEDKRNSLIKFVFGENYNACKRDIEICEKAIEWYKSTIENS